MKVTHLRPKTFKEDLYKKREIQQENDNLVLKILKLRGNQNKNEGHGNVTLTGPGGVIPGSFKKRSHSARSMNSSRSKNKRSRIGNEAGYDSAGQAGVSSILGGSKMRSKSPMNHTSKRRSRSNSVSSSKKALFAKNDKHNGSSPF
jgi:hypothetical protein